MMKKIVLVLCIVVGVVAFAVAGGQQEQGESGAEKASLTILINDSPWLPGFEALVDMYRKESGAKVTLNVTPFPGMLQKARNAAQANESEFDLVNLNEGWFTQFYANGWVTPFTEIDPDFELNENVIEYENAPRWDPEIGFSTPDGDVYGIPINGNIQLYFYRKDLLSETGMDVPDTWDEVTRFAQQVNDPPDTYGYAIRTIPGWWDFGTYINSYGKNYIEFDTEAEAWEVNLDTEAGHKALNTWLDLGWNYGPPNLADMGQSQLISLMLSGKLAQIPLVGVAAEHMQNPEESVVVDKVGAAVNPGSTPDMRATMSGIWIMGIPHNLPKDRKSNAYDFLTWFLEKDVQKGYLEAGGVPVRRDVYAEAAGDPEQGWYLGPMADSTPYIKPVIRIKEAPQINEVLSRRLNQAVIEEITPDEALEEMAKEIHKILVDGGHNVKPLSQ
jgi:multiple sugar transport system substrate-binding protein